MRLRQMGREQGKTGFMMRFRLCTTYEHSIYVFWFPSGIEAASWAGLWEMAQTGKNPENNAANAATSYRSPTLRRSMAACAAGAAQ